MTEDQHIRRWDLAGTMERQVADAAVEGAARGAEDAEGEAGVAAVGWALGVHRGQA